MSNEIVIPEEYEKAYTLHKQIKATVQSVKESCYDLGIKLKEMKDNKYYKELGYQNFEDYCETEAGIGQRQAYRMIQISENLPEDFLTSMSKIGSTKLSFLAVLDFEEREEITHTIDLESVSVRELKEEINKLKADKKKKEEQLVKAEKQCEKLTDENSKLSERVTELDEQVEKLEKRPIQIAVEESYEDIRSMNEKHSAELDGFKDDHDQKLSEDEKTALKASFKVYLTNAVDASKRLLNFISQHPDEDFFIHKTTEFLNTVSLAVENAQKENSAH